MGGGGRRRMRQLRGIEGMREVFSSLSLPETAADGGCSSWWNAPKTVVLLFRFEN